MRGDRDRLLDIPEAIEKIHNRASVEQTTFMGE